MLKALKLSFGNYKLRESSRSALIDYGKKRARPGAGPATLVIDISFIGTLLTRTAAFHGIAASSEEVRLSRVTPRRLDLIGYPQERDRRPTLTEDRERQGDLTKSNNSRSIT